jgi:hypothetical protein
MNDDRGVALRAHTNNTGTGNPILAIVENTNNSASAIKALHHGRGAAIEGSSHAAYGGKFAGPIQVLLVPSSASSHPHSSSRGALFVDHGGRLWFCKGGTSWKQLA